MIFLPFLLHVGIQITSVSAAANDSHCVNYLAGSITSTTALIAYANSTRTYGNVDCLDGDVVLVGNYLNIGQSFYFF